MIFTEFMNTRRSKLSFKFVSIVVSLALFYINILGYRMTRDKEEILERKFMKDGSSLHSKEVCSYIFTFFSGFTYPLCSIQRS